jgi:hypothetical protein
MHSLGCVYNSQVAQLKGCVDWITQNSPHRSFELDVPNTKLVSTKQSAASAPTLNAIRYNIALLLRDAHMFLFLSKQPALPSKPENFAV